MPIDDTGLAKEGYGVAGVARQYCGTLGKTGDCQIGVSVNVVTRHPLPGAVDWRLYSPESWDDTSADGDPVAWLRRSAAKDGGRAAVPDQIRRP